MKKTLLFQLVAVMLFCNSKSVFAFGNGNLFPVEYLSFSARVIDKEVVELSWVTARQKNNERFEIYRSLDGIVWELVGSLSGEGNSAVLTDYVFIDVQPFNAVTYYKLRQLDADGVSSDHPVLKFDPKDDLNYEIRIFPNPCTDFIYVLGVPADLNDFEIYDLTGRSMDLSAIKEFVNSNKIILNISSWPKGIYLFRANAVIIKIVKI